MNRAQKAIKLVNRVQQRPGWLAFPVAVWKKFGDDQAGNLAALVAYYAFASIFPLLLVLVTVLGIVLRDHHGLETEIRDSAVKNYGPLGDDLLKGLTSLHQTGPALAIGILLTFFGARGVANAMQNALNSVWEIPKADRPGFPWNYLRSFGLILAVGLGEIATSVLSSFISGGDLLPGFAIKILAALVTLVLNIGLFWLAFRLATANTISWRELRLGAIMGGIVWQLLQLVGGYYIGHQLAHSQSLYGSTFGIVLGLMAWLYLQAEATLYVAEANVVWARKLWPRSLAAPPHTAEDVRAYQLYAEAEARKKDETVSVTVPGPADDEKMPAGSPVTTRTEPETSAASGPQARGEDLMTQATTGNSRPSTAPHVIVIGAGFAGLYAVKSLRKAKFRVSLIDRNLYSTFQPLLYQVATGGLNPGDVSYAVGGYAGKYGARYLRGTLTGIDPGARRITLDDGREMTYDYLILATGVSASHFGIKGADEFTYGLYTRRDAVALRDRLMADVEGLSEGAPDSVLDVTMVGGGATGVELAGTVAELRDTVLRGTFPDVNSSRIHVRLVEAQSELLTPFDAKLRAYTRDQLVKRGVDVRLDTAIAEVTPDRVILKNGQDLHSDITVWTAGVAAPPEAKQWGLPQGRAGRIATGPDLRVTGQDRIFAVGDIGLVTDNPTPQLSQPAIQMGRFAAEQIRLIEAGQPTGTFHYHDKGQAATIGRRSAVIELAHGPDLRGTLAWLGWLGLHLFYLLGGRNRISAIINLTWRYMTWGHGGTVIVGDEPSSGARPEPAAFRPGAPGRPSRSLAGQPEPGGQPDGQPQRGGQPENDGQPAPAQARPSP